MADNTDEAELYFTSDPRYLYEKILGSGCFGAAMLFTDKGEKGKQPPEHERFVVKAMEDDEADISREYNALQVTMLRCYCPISDNS